jgi:hypothetical protein
MDEMPVIDRDDVTLVYLSSFYDYPRAGEARWDGRRYWFREAGPDSGDFELLDVGDEQWTVLDERHRLFQEHVGTHCDYDPVTQQRNIGAVKPYGPGAWDGFYRHPLARQGANPHGSVVARFRLWAPMPDRCVDDDEDEEEA